MMIEKRNTTIEVEKISNGFVVIASGRSEDNEWVHEKFYAYTMDDVLDIMNEYFSLPQDK
jgi:hypothetical protein